MNRQTFAGMVLIAVLVGAVWGVASCGSRSAPRVSAGESYIHLAVPLSGTVEIDERAFADSYLSHWGSEITMEETTEPGDSSQGIRRYQIEQDTHSVVLRLVDRPLSEDLLQITIDSAYNLDEKEVERLRRHQAAVLLDHGSVSPTPVERLRFAGQVLLTLLQLDEAVGFVDFSAQSYRAKSQWMPEFEGKTSLDVFDLFLLFANVHNVDMGDSVWMHTHGMEQFGLPDLEVWFSDKGNHEYYYALVSDVVLYMVETGNVLRVGDTAELMGDGIIYDIAEAEPEEWHAYGAFGAIQLKRQ
jgi:hypothetical protein